ncbi:MAG: molybdate ABC transporter substrate-binding protein [Propionibacteriaceae bacterium]|nr:molybdate ABC transporter substrate-binding protein [Propionibacteriaceae bacterium]
MKNLRTGLLAGIAALGLALTGCAGTPATTPSSEPTGTSQAPETPQPAEVTLTVFAAASLTKTFTELGAAFEADHPGVTVSFNFAGSSDLVAQIQQGAPADVFASADEKNMTKATDEKLIAGDPVIFATNVLSIAVPPDNPAKVAGLADLARDDVQVVICAPEVPCGAATVKVAEAAGITIKPVSEEAKVTDVLAKVASGDADAGLVYATDVAGAEGKVLGIDFPESAGAVNNYPIGALANSANADLAAEFVALVTGATGQQVLADAGFGKP